MTLNIGRKLAYTGYRFLKSVREEGLQTTYQKMLHRLRNRNFLVKEKYFQGVGRDPDKVYEIWRQRRALTPEQIKNMRADSEKLSWRPKISVVTPSYKPDAPYL